MEVASIISIILGIICIALAVAAIPLWVASIVLAVRHARKQGDSVWLVVLFLVLFGPLAGIIWLFFWLFFRPRTKVIQRSADDYAIPEDAIAAATQLDMLGEWDAAIALYRGAVERWPEHEHYIQECIRRIEEKRLHATTGIV